jgi:hypothetical protein
MGTLFLALGVAGALIRLHPSDRDPSPPPPAVEAEPATGRSASPVDSPVGAESPETRRARRERVSDASG